MSFYFSESSLSSQSSVPFAQQAQHHGSSAANGATTQSRTGLKKTELFAEHKSRIQEKCLEKLRSHRKEILKLRRGQGREDQLAAAGGEETDAVMCDDDDDQPAAAVAASSASSSSSGKSATVVAMAGMLRELIENEAQLDMDGLTHDEYVEMCRQIQLEMEEEMLRWDSTRDVDDNEKLLEYVYRRDFDGEDEDMLMCEEIVEMEQQYLDEILREHGILPSQNNATSATGLHGRPSKRLDFASSEFLRVRLLESIREHKSKCAEKPIFAVERIPGTDIAATADGDAGGPANTDIADSAPKLSFPLPESIGEFFVMKCSVCNAYDVLL